MSRWDVSRCCSHKHTELRMLKRCIMAKLLNPPQFRIMLKLKSLDCPCRYLLRARIIALVYF
jgi:hypothetical protein